MLTGTPIITNVTGGMQDQMRFEDENGNWFTPSPDLPSNHTGKYKKNMENGPSQYIQQTGHYKDHLKPLTFGMIDVQLKTLVIELKEVYNLGHDKRVEAGMKGREWALSDEAGFTSGGKKNE